MKFWVEWEDADSGDDNGSIRWGSADESKVDLVLAYASMILGQADTVS